MRLTLIDRYLLSETFKTWLAVTVVLAAIMLGNTFSQLLARTASGEFDRALLLSLVGATSASFFKTLIPISLLLAVLLSLGRLYRDNEMAVINACGIGLARLYRPFLLFGVVLALLTAWLSLALEPAAKRRASQLRADARFATNLAATGSGQFQILAGGRGAVWAEQVSADQLEMHNVLVWFRGRDGVKLIRAEQGFQRLDMATSEGDLLLVEGTRYEGNAGESNYQITRFRQHGLHLPVPRPEFNLNRDSTPTPALLASDAAADQAEIQRRVSLPLMVIILVLLAVPLARVSPRQGRYGRLVIGMLCYLLYSNLLAAAAVWVAQEQLPASIGIWWVHALALGLVAWVFWPGQLWPSLRRQARPA